MLKHTIIPMVLMLSGCVHVAGYDNEAHTVTIHAAKLASFSTTEDEARKFCGSNVKLLRAGEANNGIYIVAGGNVTQPVQRDEYIFRCLGPNSITLE